MGNAMPATPGVRLLDIDERLCHCFELGIDEFERVYRIGARDVADFLQDVLRANLRVLHEIPRSVPFGTFLTIDEKDANVIGTCAFKTGPKSDASIEIAYYTFPPFEGRGYATAAAEAMLEIARGASGQVRCVMAYTLPERNASCRVLEKVGMRFVGEVMDIEDGRVWRWETPL